ncbi:MAG: methylmalonyl-CoA mutase family protein [Flavobacteriales bacterium]|nr:methylmalonyl-CoA mutase family protein [Flavobacteriales bacterium]MCX7768207.1 methylmalonyl-CoA mutase family protein [Flavobacteriales bacterium]MDW8409158.1 methylmalonyl-CoA mutase family protein [Flavobacteriales bacterium]
MGKEFRPELFEPGDLETWLKAALASATQEEISKALQHQDADNIVLNALYFPGEDIKPLRNAAVNRGYPAVRQWIWYLEEDKVREDVDEAFEGGATEVEIFGEYPASSDFFKHLLQGLDPERMVMWFDVGESHAMLPFLLADEFSVLLTDPSYVRGGINYDPLTALAFTGRYIGKKSEAVRTVRAVWKEGGALLPLFKMLSLQGIAYHDAGASPSLELALILALVEAYLQWLEPESLDQLAHRMEVRLSADVDVAATVARFQAFPVLWQNFTEALGLQANPPTVTAVLSRLAFSAFDVHNNLVRQTLAAVGAVMGGCDCMMAEPYDVVKKLPDRRSYRLTRNLMLLLKYESDLQECLRLAEGSLYIQQYAGRMAEEAWKYFLDIQKAGGFEAALEKGYIQSLVHRKWQEQVLRFQNLERIVVGANKYPLASERIEELPLLPFRYSPVRGNKAFEPLQENQLLRRLDEARWKATSS